MSDVRRQRGVRGKEKRGTVNVDKLIGRKDGNWKLEIRHWILGEMGVKEEWPIRRGG